MVGRLIKQEAKRTSLAQVEFLLFRVHFISVQTGFVIASSSSPFPQLRTRRVRSCRCRSVGRNVSHFHVFFLVECASVSMNGNNKYNLCTRLKKINNDEWGSPYLGLRSNGDRPRSKENLTVTDEAIPDSGNIGYKSSICSNQWVRTKRLWFELVRVKTMTSQFIHWPRHASLPALGIGDRGFEIRCAGIRKAKQNRRPAKLQLTHSRQKVV